MMRRTALWIPFLVLFVAHTADASEDLKKAAEQRQAQKEAIQKEISRSKAAADRLSAQEAAVIEELEALNRELDRTRKKERQTRTAIKETGRQREALQARQRALSKEMEALEQIAAQRLAAFYKLTRLGIGPLLFSSQSLSELSQRRKALESVLAYDHGLWSEFQEKRADQDRLSSALARQQEQLDRLLKEQEEETALIGRKKRQRADLLKKIKKERALTLASLASLEGSVKELEQTIRSLKKDMVSRPVPKNGRSGAFLAEKGSLPMPVQGPIVRSFGPYKGDGLYQIDGFHNGVNIGAGPGQAVQAVYEGQVIYSDWFKGYGNLIIIDHGAHYYTLSAQLDEVYKKAGEAVEPGEPIGTVGDTGTHAGPGLYFEVRHHGKPEDPMVWFGR